ncbi:hypothetical protein SKAU_G00119910 [Synaphobranchus kaupii]|uniref:Uncharacterized protein n=1 Tax=Synaphobranchus kaupii TaxID=118154 RepID=A0A9Q1FND3_SYNKA|nr:hypothetical protein SKAU_G00119910 [Synaphobranchus kaupii]
MNSQRNKSFVTIVVIVTGAKEEGQRRCPVALAWQGVLFTLCRHGSAEAQGLQGSGPGVQHRKRLLCCLSLPQTALTAAKGHGPFRNRVKRGKQALSEAGPECTAWAACDS